MKLNRIITLCAVVAAAVLTLSSAMAQDNGTPTDNGGGQRRNRQGGGPGGGPGGDPAQFQQQILDHVRETLNFTNDTDWSAVQPLVQKVMDAQREVGFGGGMRGMMGRSRNGQGGNNNRFGPPPSAEQEALQNALDSDAPSAQIKDLLAKYKASQAAKQAKLEAAQDALKAVLTPKQEAQAYLMRLVR